MNLFKHLESARRFPPRRILLYGIRGIGTSSFAAGLSAPVFVPADESVAHIECPRFPVVKHFADLMQALQELYVEPHDYRTVILDPLEAVERLIREDVCHQHNVKDLTDVQRASNHVLVRWQRLLRRLDLLHGDIDLHVVLVGHAHETLIRCTPPDCAIAPQRHCPARHFSPAVARRSSALLQGWCDEVLFATHAMPAPSAEVASTNASQTNALPTTVQPVSEPPADRRVIYTHPSPTHSAKNHLNLPPRLPFYPAALLPYLRRAGVSAKPQAANLH